MSNLLVGSRWDPFSPSHPCEVEHSTHQHSTHHRGARSTSTASTRIRWNRFALSRPSRSSKPLAPQSMPVACHTPWPLSSIRARLAWCARSTCRAVPGVPENARSRVSKLADRVRVLLAASPDGTAATLPPAALEQPHRSDPANIPVATSISNSIAIGSPATSPLPLPNTQTHDELDDLHRQYMYEYKHYTVLKLSWLQRCRN